ncbi:aminotransferase class I/II-fold pyridoxal phosphate-dependent enzyme [Phytohabitans sp. ZYX-F-186]|uniref:Aminotransferase class I/II-fold pyridoxal phosphate-dependent enzyme n=1 Tax=Phytohabitans maris TaxID=3071409 RepID=A0ABU0ZQN7_9ACTN|nr:aminotransferase class I/II-fold pyridoxal phosphate-dependent enzyme [Phytohabitans sp. ZYX-F-186]MDQ7908227.1 aminotransferase class I/II-fold pyridoxal phosphate-dependent enzyme [Phytohabitans sp. ZYX-F-186]
MTGRIHLSAPDVTQLEEAYVVRALRSGWVAPAGPDLDAFERELAERVGVACAVGVSSGTAALHLALLALGAGGGQAVVLPTLTFAATANAVVYTGAEPVFVDSDPATGNLDVGLLDDLLGRLRRERRPIGAVVPVDLFGACADYTALLPVCERYGVPVLEDAAEALGAAHGGRRAGSFGQAAAVSFNGNKIMTTSGGGMLLTDAPALAARCRYLSTQARQPVPHYEHTEIGYNYRLSNLLAALGRAQLARLDGMVARRRSLRERYRKLFAPAAGVTVLGADDSGSNCWLTVIVVDPRNAGWHADDLRAELARHDVETRPVWKPMHLQPVFAGARGAITGAGERLFTHGLTLPSGSSLTDAQVDRVTDLIGHFLEVRR